MLDEVIADSEDEESYFPPVTSTSPRSKLSSDIRDLSSSTARRTELAIESPIQTATFNPRSRPADTSSISLFTPNVNSILHAPIPHKSGANDQSSISAFSSNTEGLVSAVPKRPRPKPRPAYKVAQAPAEANSSTINSSDPNVVTAAAGPSMLKNHSAAILDPSGFDNFSLADRAKMRSRTSTIKSTPTPPTTKSNPGSSSKSKAKPKKPKILVSDPDTIEITSSEDDFSPKKARPKTKPVKRPKTNHSVPEPLFIPLPDSQRTVTTIPFPSSSILPPSDPPPPSTILASSPPRAGLLDGGSPLSSPLPGVRKRKRPAPAAMDLDFSLDGLGTKKVSGFQASEVRANDDAEDARMMPPPPPPRPFFTGSSSFEPSPALDARAEAVSAMIETGPEIEKGKPTMAKKAAAKKSKKSAANAEMDLEAQAKTSSRGGLESKPKKIKRKSARDVEVLIETKAKATSSGKEPFKSKEFVDDEDDEDDPLVLAPAQPSHIVRSATTGSESELSSLQDSEVESVINKKKGGKGEKNKKRKVVVLSEDELNEDEIQLTKKSTGAGKKGKLALSDSDDNPEVDAADIITASNSSKRPSSVKGKPKQKKAKVSKKVGDDGIAVEDSGVEIETATKEQHIKENLPPNLDYLTKSAPLASSISSSSKTVSRAFSISRTKTTPMSELIRRVNSLPGSPFRPLKPSTSSSTYSPLLKSSRSLLSRIAPLHPTRRPPPPPPPPVPKAKERKSKKMLEMEEKWEDELSESVDGWACMEESERVLLRRRKKELELGGYDE